LQIHEYEAGTTIGYGRNGILSRTSRIAAIPIGYADGFDRRLGNGRGEVLVNGHRAPIVGNVCMDICMIDVTDIPCNEGDRVEIFGENLPVQELAQRLDTIAYEVLTSISSRVKRIYYRE
jgi:alanine racemase